MKTQSTIKRDRWKYTNHKEDGKVWKLLIVKEKLFGKQTWVSIGLIKMLLSVTQMIPKNGNITYNELLVTLWKKNEVIFKWDSTNCFNVNFLAHDLKYPVKFFKKSG